ncbi:PA domain-containing protein [Arthrobacter crystallopoietes]|uniref:PA domain-containing protein n=2 Tax=Crystallibacter crystallopoietes TaxID=37928 RepID=A0A1H0ZDB1_9MICC|nr:aminopeptidase [Arthrobacter crystallopoietes]SDQ25475.1 PA domain-containing protein [Arthrobacter crystallopoietes]
MNHRRNKRVGAITAVVALALGAGLPANADNGTDTEKLREAVTADGIYNHLEQLQKIANDNGGNRAGATEGYEAGAEYIESELEDAGYDPVRQYFDYQQFIEHTPSELAQVSPTEKTYVNGTDFTTMEYSGAGDVTAAVTAVDVNFADPAASTSGCEAADFEGFTPGNIALIQRGTCTFGVKAQLAANAEASAVIIFNQGNGDDRSGLLNGTLGEAVAIPTVGTTFAVGQDLAKDPATTASVTVDAEVKDSTTFNILADTDGRADRTVVVGAHLDSVAEGPGINDNGSGSAAILETAIQMAEMYKDEDGPRNRVRFAFWGAEESGLVGSTYYVSQLSKEEIKQHALNLNFDMVGSTNFVRFVYDGDGDAFGQVGPNGSAHIEHVFNDYFTSQGLASAPTAFDGRSDYAAFIANGIPAGGLFTGAEGEKTAKEAEKFGGMEGEAYDPCYHQACDDIENVSMTALDEMSDAIAHTTLTFAETTSAVNGTAKGGSNTGTADMKFKGNAAQK